MMECETCHGAGEVYYLPRNRYSPEDVESMTCSDCRGAGEVESPDDEAVEPEWELDNLEHFLATVDKHPELFAPFEIQLKEAA
jgi:hypothetical protein